MSKIRLSKQQYFEAVNKLLETWVSEEGHAKDGFPKKARAVLFDALNIIRAHARRGERVAVVLSKELLATWIMEHSTTYKNLRDLASQIRKRLPLGNKRGFGGRRLRHLFAGHLLTYFGLYVEAVDAPNLRIQVRVTAGTLKEQHAVPVPIESRDVPLVELAPSADDPDDPTEAIHLLGLLQHYRRKHDALRYASIDQHVAKFRIELPELRKRTIRGVIALLRRRYVRGSRFGLLEIGELTEVQKVALEVWYRHALTQWESASGEQDITGSATRGALARKLGQHEREKHPDELLAEAAARERTEALQHWALERVEPTDVERSHGRKTFERVVLTSSATLERIFVQLPQLGTIDELAAWRDQQFASYKTLEEEAVAFAEEQGLPMPNIQRAIRRLARPREQSWTELEARKIFEPGVSLIESEWLVQGMIGQLLQIMDRPLLDGGLEFAVERELRYLIAVYRLIVQANDAHRG
jgi:hypothetical protein